MSVSERTYSLIIEPRLALNSKELENDIKVLKDTVQASIDNLTKKQIKLKMEFTKVDTGMFKNIQSEIINIGKLLDDLKKKDFSAVINIDPGQKSSAQMELLAQKARLLTQQVQDSLDKISGMRGISATMEQLNQLLVFQSKFQPDKIYERIDNAMGGKTSARMENIISELNKDLNLLTEITGVKLDTSRIDELDKALQGTSNSAEKLVESINNAIQPLSSKSIEIKDVLGIEGVQASVKQIDDMFTDLRTKIETSLDLSTINMHVEAINAQIDKIDVDKAVKDALEGNTKIDVKVNVGADTEAINRTKDDIKQIAENVASIDLSKADQIKTKFKGLADGTSEVASETERWKEIMDEAIVSLERVTTTDKEGNSQVRDSLTRDYAAREQLRERETSAINKQNAAYQKYLADQESARQKEIDLLQKAEIAQRAYEESLNGAEEKARQQLENELNILDARNRKLDEKHESAAAKEIEREEKVLRGAAAAYIEYQRQEEATRTQEINLLEKATIAENKYYADQEAESKASQANLQKELALWDARNSKLDDKYASDVASEIEREEKVLRDAAAAYIEYQKQEEAARIQEASLLEKAEIAERQYREQEQRDAEEAKNRLTQEIALWDMYNEKLDEAYFKEKDQNNDAFVNFDTNIGKYIAKLKEYVAAANEAGLADSENVIRLNGMIKALENLQNAAKNRGPDDTGISEFRHSLDKLTNSAEEAARAVREETKISLDSAAEDAKTKAETLKAVARYEAIRKQIINDINKSSKAEHGTRAADYKSLIDYHDNVEKLFKDFEDHKITLEQFKDGLENTGIGAANAANNIRAAGEMTETFGDKIKKNIKNLSAYFSVSRMFTLVIRYMRDLIKTSIELDKEMGQLRIVTDETEDSYSRFSETIAKTAKDIGASMTDLISATTTFARLGYSLDESSVLAKYTAMLQQVGDIDASAAQDAVTAITKAFANEVDIDNIESVMDRLVVVGRNIAHVCSDAYLVIGYNGQSRFGMIA